MVIFGYFFKNGGADYMDFFNFHYLVGKEEPSISKYVDYWKQYVGGKEIWLSETGNRDVGDRYTISSDENKEAEWVKIILSKLSKTVSQKFFGVGRNILSLICQKWWKFFRARLKNMAASQQAQ